MSSLLFESVKRIAIGMGIDLVFNCFSNFVQIHYYNIPVARVWKKCWLRHMLANLLVTMKIVPYTTQTLLSAFKHVKLGQNSIYSKIARCFKDNEKRALRYDMRGGWGAQRNTVNFIMEVREHKIYWGTGEQSFFRRNSTNVT